MQSDAIWRRCFLCSAVIPETSWKSKGDASFKSHYKILFKYLLTQCTTNQLDNQLFETILQFANGRRGDQELVKFCGSCRKLAEDMVEMQLELEVVQMKIVEKVKSVRQAVVANSRMYGGSAEVGRTFELFKNELEQKERDGADCGGERQFLEVLCRFQAFVYENDSQQFRIPLVFLKQLAGVGGDTKDYSSGPIVKEEPFTVWNEMNDHSEEPLEETNYCEEMETGVMEEVKTDNLMSDSKVNENPAIEEEPGVIVSPKRGYKISRPMKKSGSASVKLKGTTSSATVKKEVKTASKNIPMPTRVNLGRAAASRASERWKEVGRRKAEYQIFTKIVEPRKPKPKVKKTPAQILARELLEQSRMAQTRMKRKTRWKGRARDKRHFCEQCSFVCQHQFRLEQHLKEHEGPEKNHECPDCLRRFTHKQYFGIHLNQHVTQYKCDVCEEFVVAMDMKTHLKSHNDKIYECNHCEHSFGTFTGLIFHSKTHKRANLKCQVCREGDSHFNKPFVRRSDLLKHLYDCHEGFKDLLLNCDDPDCPKTFFEPQHKISHMNSHLRRFVCSVCDKAYNDRNTLDSHIRIVHLNEKPYGCNLCPARFTIKSSLQSHQVKNHNFPKFKCELCPDKEYSESTALANHKRVCHEGIRPFTCNICGKDFPTRMRLRKHEHVHTETKDFTCEICGFATKSNDLLKCHKLKHDGEKKFQCPQCPKAFAVRKYLQDHLRTHTLERPFQCELCGSAFNQRGALNIHKKKHKDGSSSFVPRGPRVKQSDPGQGEEKRQQVEIEML